MIVYLVRLLEVPDERWASLTGAFREGGLWYDLSRSLPGHIHTDLLQSPSSTSKFLSIEFWMSIDACLAAQSTPELKTFLKWLGSTTSEFEDLDDYLGFCTEHKLVAMPLNESTLAL